MLNFPRYNAPGKFEGGTVVDPFVYDTFFMFSGAESDSVIWPDGASSWRYDGPFLWEDLRGLPWRYAREIYAKCVGITVYEDDRGFFYVDYFDDRWTFNDAWNKTLDHVKED